MDVKDTLKGTFSTVKEKVSGITATINSPEAQEKVRKGLGLGLAGAVGIINALTYAATSAVVGAKNGVVDGLADSDSARRK
jgi:hypothetical protein